MKVPVSNHPIARMPWEQCEASISERFEAVVRRHPDRVAVKAVDETVTYAEINSAANRLAREIVARRGNAAEPIALLLESGPGLITAMLAVLKAGKWFILLDCCFPAARTLALVRDSQASCVIAEREIPESLRGVFADPAHHFEVGSRCGPADADNLNQQVAPQAIAAVVYTSGSTGEPKGVLWTHEDLLHRAMLRTRENEATAHDRIALLTTGTANTVSNCFFALLNGATVCPFPVHKAGLGPLASWLAEERITICPFSATLFRSFVSGLTGREVFPSLRIVRLRSETVRKSDFELFKRYFAPPCKFVAGLSCSEAGQLTSFVLTHDDVVPEDTVPIGFPVPDKEIFLLDEAGNEVGPNAVGEIVVRSRYLSLGYWKKPELTAQRFKADSSGSAERWCFTGDLGLRLTDGCLVHKGRKDFRVKVRGFGVELAEIEGCLADHCGVGETAVIVHSDNGSDPRLTAYYTAAAQPPPGHKELRDFLAAKLPDYMVPAKFLLLEEMPLTTNGKIDRGSLPGPDKVRPEMSSAYVAPANVLEQELVEIWEQALDLRPIGRNDRFFDLGGDSLAAMRVISEIGKHFQFDISLATFVHSATVAEVAAMIGGNLRQQSEAARASTIWRTQRAGENVAPLSFAQQRLWFLDQLEPGGFTYNLFSAYRLQGDLDVAALEQSLNEIIRRHEILRTVFKCEDGKPVQVVLPRLVLRIAPLDLRGCGPAEERWTKARRLFAEEAKRPFDLASGPLLRFTLLQLGASEHVLLQATHHIVFDGWSERILFHELGESYEAVSAGQTSRLADLPVQYADYAQWQRDWLEGNRLEYQLSYWKKRLENISTLQLPADYPKQRSRTRRGGRRYFVVSRRITSELKNLSRERDATLFMTLAAAFQTLLQRYSHQTDIAIGTPVAGRTREEFDGLIGCFLNMLVLRLDFSGDPTFDDLLGRAREMCLEALTHQDLPFEKLVEEVRPERSLEQNPLFQTTFAFQNTARALRLAGITVEELEVEAGIARFDLHLFMEDIQGQLQGYFDYDASLFNRDTIERMVGHFKTLLEGIVADPARRISGLPLLTEAEKQTIVLERNKTKILYPESQCIHELFEAQVERSPDAIAITCEEQQCTYRELNCRANQLAHYLRELGVGPNVLVGICVERSLNRVVGLLGILKAGGAYVPLDPAYPAERLGFMLKDAHAGIVLTDLVSRRSLPSTNARVICLDRDREKMARKPQDNLINQNTAESLAYVIYTSGSTGAPKGVEVPHRGVVRLLFGVNYVRFEQTHTFLHMAPISFDAASFEIWGALLHGARCVLFPSEVPSPRELGDVLKKHRVDTLWLTAALFNAVIDQEPRALAEVKRLLIGGEALSVAHVRKGLSLLPNTEIINGYGPTESATFTCCYSIPREFDENLSSIPIGKPIGNTQAYILDMHLNPVPVGVTGEIYIGGDGVARGYLDRPDLTAEKFIPDDFLGVRGGRLYKTGDLGRYLADGNIEFLGRMDHQVKIRGNRIEPGEIESVLGEHPMIDSAVVMAREDAVGEKRLVGYVVAQPGTCCDAEMIRQYVKQKLPEYMIPSAWVFLEALPLGPTGKVDRSALPAWSHDRAESRKTYRAPRTALEKTLADIWSEVLHVDNVGIHENFFDLGGHSLLITKLIARACDAFGIDVPLRTVFESPTIQQLAEAIGQMKALARSREECEVVAGADELSLEMVPGCKTTGKE